jgi:hypothetical protein
MDQPQKAVAERLRALLSKPGSYRNQWMRQQTRRTPAGSVNQSAVAHVLAAHLWETGQVSDSETDLPRRLKDTVSRALGGRVIAASTLQLFIEAFRLSHADAADLWSRFVGEARGKLSVVRTSAPGPEPPPRDYRTISLHEFHTLGSDRLPAEHRTVQVIEATGRVARYRYRFDTTAAVVAVVRGGRVSPVFKDELPGIYGVDITLTDPLNPGDTGSFEYRTIFAYKNPPEPIFRRAALTRVENVEIHVQFDRRALPQAVTWCVWESYDSPTPSTAEEVTLRADHSVHRYVEALERAAVGFAWVW